MLFSEANKLLESGYLALETGYCRLSNGQMLVAVLTCMPGCKSKMVEWWFGKLDKNEKNTFWCQYRQAYPDVTRSPKPLGKHIDAVCHIEQKIEEQIKCNLIHFHHPSDFLSDFDPESTKSDVAICANVYTDDKVLEYRLIHYLRDTVFGCEMRSRYWLMKACDETALRTMRHCLEEMANLAAFLPNYFQGSKD